MTLTYLRVVSSAPSRPEASLKMGPKPIFSGEAGTQGFPHLHNYLRVVSSAPSRPEASLKSEEVRL